MIVFDDLRHPVEHRARAALVELGYPDAHVSVMPAGTTIVHGRQGGSTYTQLIDKDYRVGWGAPLPVLWRAFVTAGLDMPCWRCWEMELLGLFKSWWHASCAAEGQGIEDCRAKRPGWWWPHRA